MMNPKRLILTLALGVCTLLIPLHRVHAQSAFHKGSHTAGLALSLSVGPIPFWTAVLPFVGVSYEYGVLDGIFSDTKGSLGVGVHGELAARMGVLSNELIFCDDYIFLGGLTSFHYEFLLGLDTYVSPSLGISFINGSPDFNWNVITGTRYYFTPHFAAGLEYS